MRRINKLAIAIIVLFSTPIVCSAQKTLEFFYVAHDRYERDISEELDKIRRNARFNEYRTVVFYLANGGSPKFFKVSPDDDRQYTTFMETLNGQTSHNVYPDVDRLMILELLSNGRTVPRKGLDGYERVSFNFYINPGFVQMNYCDAVIGRLFWDMEMDKLPRNAFEINIYHHKDDGGDYREDKLFGRKGLLGNFEPIVDTF